MRQTNGVVGGANINRHYPTSGTLHLLSSVKHLRGWRELTEFTGMAEGILRRMIGLYGFPPPTLVVLPERGGTRCHATNVWLENEVSAWLEKRKGEFNGR